MLLNILHGVMVLYFLVLVYLQGQVGICLGLGVECLRNGA